MSTFKIFGRLDLKANTAQYTLSHINQAVNHLRKAGLVQRVARGVFTVTDRGLKVLEQPPRYIDFSFLRRFPEYAAYEQRLKDRSQGPESATASSSSSTPAAPSPYPELSLGWNASLTLMQQPEAAPPPAPQVAPLDTPAPARRSQPPPRRNVAPAQVAERVHLSAAQRAHERLESCVESDMIDIVAGLHPAHLVAVISDMMLTQGPKGTAVAAEATGPREQEWTMLSDPLGTCWLYVAADDRLDPELVLEQFQAGMAVTGARAAVLVVPGHIADACRGFAAAHRAHVTVCDREELAYLLLQDGTGLSDEVHYDRMRLDHEFFEALENTAS